MNDNTPEAELDLSGLLCPLPVLRARKALTLMAPGSILKVVATDPMSMIDMPHFCTEQGHGLLAQEQRGNSFHFRIKRK
jgi:tRNA 2-thiouridine synthesizing protein A